MLEGTKKNMNIKSLIGKHLNWETGTVVQRIRLENCLPNGKANKYNRNDRENKHNPSEFKCLIVNPAKIKRFQLGSSLAPAGDKKRTIRFPCSKVV